MKFTARLLGTSLIAGLLLTACTKESGLLSSEAPVPGGDEISFRSNAPALAIWADCEGFGTVGTPTSFKPTAGNFDELYNGANFMNGLGAVSESKPGDQDWNGGRWHVNTLKEGVDPDKYADVCSVEGIDPDDFVSTSTYFECPLLPRRGK